MDPLALNHDPSAVTSDKSCKYPPVPIDSSGGEISFAKVALTFPSSALNTAVNISVNEVTALPSATSMVGTGYRFGPSGLQFSVPVPVCINISDIHGDKMNQNLKLFHSSDDVTWNQVDNYTVDPVTQQACGKLHHFTVVAAFITNTSNTTNTTQTVLSQMPNEDLKMIAVLSIILATITLVCVLALIISVIVFRVKRQRIVAMKQQEIQISLQLRYERT
jgi:hypothetical protein